VATASTTKGTRASPVGVIRCIGILVPFTWAVKGISGGINNGTPSPFVEKITKGINMRRLQTNLPDAARAKALHDAGIKMDDIVDATGLPQRTIYNIVNLVGPWAEIVTNNEIFQRYRNEVKKMIQTGSLELSKACLNQIEVKLPQASAAQAAVVFGILHDKERIQAGESNLNIAVHVTKEDLASREDVLARVATLLAGKET